MARLSTPLIAGLVLAGACSQGAPIDHAQPKVLHVVENLSVANGKKYELDRLVKGARVYTDRKYVVTNVPSAWEGLEFIRTANLDKLDKGSQLVSFQVAVDATVYVAYDARAKKLPDWLEGWDASDESFDTDDVPRRLYKKTFPMGARVVLGGNLAGEAAGAESNYNVLVRPGT